MPKRREEEPKTTRVKDWERECAAEIEEIGKMSRYVKPDKHDLDNGLIDQPDMVLRAVDHMANAVMQKDLAEQKRDEAKAGADRFLRQDPDGKPNETAIKHMVEEDDDVREANYKLIGWTNVVGRWSGLLKALDARGKSLEQLVKLWEKGYYSDPSRRSESRDSRR